MFNNVNVAKVKHKAKCITCSMKHRKHLTNMNIPMQVAINMQIKEFYFYSLLYSSHYNKQTNAYCG